MPTLAVPRDELFARLGRLYTDEEFDALAFDFGVELDDVMTESEAAGARQLAPASGSAGGGDGGGGETVIYYIALPANRSDLLGLEGFARALNVFLGREDVPVRGANVGPPP